MQVLNTQTTNARQFMGISYADYNINSSYTGQTSKSIGYFLREGIIYDAGQKTSGGYIRISQKITFQQ